MKYFLKCLYNFANFHDRARRKEVYFYILYSSIFGVLWFFLWMGILNIAFNDSPIKNDGLFILITLCFSSLYIFFFISFLSVSVRRFHDSEILFDNLNPTIIVLLFMLAFKGVYDTENTVKSILGYPREPAAPPIILSAILMFWGWGLLIYLLYFLLIKKGAEHCNKYGHDPRIDDPIENARKIPKMDADDSKHESSSDNNSDEFAPKTIEQPDRGSPLPQQKTPRNVQRNERR